MKLVEYTDDDGKQRISIVRNADRAVIRRNTNRAATFRQYSR